MGSYRDKEEWNTLAQVLDVIAAFAYGRKIKYKRKEVTALAKHSVGPELIAGEDIAMIAIQFDYDDSGWDIVPVKSLKVSSQNRWEAAKNQSNR